MRRALALALVLAAAGAAVFATGLRGQRPETASPYPNVEYDGRLVFVRVEYDMGYGGGFGRNRGRQPPWMHDYPTSDIHMMKIMKELTLAAPRIDGSNILRLDDPALFDYPILYMSEPGFWQMSDGEAKGLGDYLRKGGFIIFDDFRDEHWYNLEAQMRRVLPDGKWLPLDAKQQVYHSFFEIDALDLLTSYGTAQAGVLRHVRGQRPDQAADRGGELQQRSR